MNWLVWNIKGVNKKHKQKEFKKMLQMKKISLFGLIETRVKQHKANKILANIAPT